MTLKSIAVGALSSIVASSAMAGELHLVCSPDNNLHQVLVANRVECVRHDKAATAVTAATHGSAVMILADGYPHKTTPIAATVFEKAAQKKLKLYVEFPASLPDVQVGKARRTRLERAVVASDIFGKDLAKMRLLAIHDCHFVETQAKDPYVVLAKVAGYDTAAYGLNDTTSFPLLFEHPNGHVLVSTTKLSQFVTARYAPKAGWQALWKTVFEWLQLDREAPLLEWTPTVRPTYGRSDPLPNDAVKQAIVRGVDWHSKAGMLLSKASRAKYDELRRKGVVKRGNPIGPLVELPAGDGEHGVLEGCNSTIRHDGSQPVRWWLRTDSNGESALAFALRSKIDGDERSARVAANLLDWVYFTSGLFQKDPAKGNFGLVHWAPDNDALYGDNDIKIILSCMGTAALLKDDRWNEVLLQNITANFRTTGRHGFRGGALSSRNLSKDGWRKSWDRGLTNYAPHYEAWIWAAYLWAYDKTKDPLFLERTRDAIHKMMVAYPAGWTWTNGIQQERSRMLLTLAWLIRVDDKPQYRRWLKQLATDMRKCQDSSGGIREELGDLRRGRYRPPRSNAEYGKHEAAAIHENGDPMADMLYTCNFAFLGLHEAYAATGDELYLEMADGLEEFFVRIQIRSESQPELDGSWFRCFDYEKWDYWGANADAGWGAWSIEVGWTQGWIPTVLAMRELDLNLWDLTKNSKIGEHWKRTRATMLPDAQPRATARKKGRDAEQGKADSGEPAECAVSPEDTDGPAPRLPNIIFIMADDHAAHGLSCYGSTILKTPNIDRLAKEGKRFTHAMGVNSLCAPARAALLTGKHSHINGMHRNNSRFDGAQQTFPKLLQAAGYQTAIVGKWHLVVEPTGFDYYKVMRGHGSYFDPDFRETGKGWHREKGYLTDLITDGALDWLKAREQNKPFCLMVHHKAPHGPDIHKEEHAKLFENETIPAPDTLHDDWATREPLRTGECGGTKLINMTWGQDIYRVLLASAPKEKRPRTEAVYQQMIKGYMRLVASLDENVGRLLDHIDKAGLRENTIVIYTSDNGFFLGDHGMYNKMWMYEESQRLPLLVRYPGTVKPGSTNSDLVSMLDFAPTFLEAAGAPIPKSLQGRSILPLLRGERPAQWRKGTYYHFYSGYGVPEHYGIVTKQHKLMHFPGFKKGNYWELFDLDRDPMELTNVFGEKAYVGITGELQKQLTQLRRLSSLRRKAHRNSCKAPMLPLPHDLRDLL